MLLWDLFMKACIVIFMMVNGHHGRLKGLLLEFFKNSHFWPFGGKFKVRICPKFEIFTNLGVDGGV